MNKSSLHVSNSKCRLLFIGGKSSINEMNINKSKEKQYAAVLFLTPASLVNKGFSS